MTKNKQNMLLLYHSKSIFRFAVSHISAFKSGKISGKMSN